MENWYPKRLLDLRNVLEYNKHEATLLESEEPKPLQRSERRKTVDEWIKHEQFLKLKESTTKVRLVSTKESEKRHGAPELSKRYVTLSHCWGEVGIKKLTRDTLQSFLDGIPYGDLPKTFRDAIKFACALESFGVRWLWIDAFCIIQDDEEDWLAESKQMQEIYTNSFCNISATAATDSSKGLFYERKSQMSWVDTIRLERDDLPNSASGRVNCIIHDLSFWRDTVENAPANRRSWIFQERLLAPRVVHWCKDQVAFECRDSDRAESRPDGLSHYQVSATHVVKDTRLKSIDLPTASKLRALRLKSKRASFVPGGIDEPIYLYEIWKRYVELYSKMELRFKKDRLIALSGIARRLEAVLRANTFEKEEYVAGMWKEHLASQLLWYVNDGEEKGEERQPLEDTRTDSYRAPTFSWASVETPRGITFPETTTDKGLFITLEVMRLTYLNGDQYGIITGGYLIVRGVLRKIELIDLAWAGRMSAIASWFSRTKTAGSLPEIRTAPSQLGSFNAVSVVLVLGLSLFGILIFLQILIAFMSRVILGVSTMLFLFLVGTTELQLASQRRSPRATEEHGEKNRFIWSLVKEIPKDEAAHNATWREKQWALAQSKKEDKIENRIEWHGMVWLDSPASAPSIFGRNGNLFCLPVALDTEYLSCLLLQAVVDGTYGVRYRRVGHTKISRTAQSEGEIEDIKNPPGTNKEEDRLGKYYYGTGGETTGISTICII